MVQSVGQGTVVATNGGAPGAVGIHASTATNDLVVAFFYSRESVDGVVTFPSGWTNIRSVRSANGYVQAAWRIKDASWSTVTPTIQNFTSGNSGDSIVVWTHSFRGHDAVNPIRGASTVSSWASSLSYGPIGVTSLPTMLPGDGLVVFGGRMENVTTQVTLTGDGLTWSQLGLADTTLGSDASAVTQLGVNGSAADVAATSKTITSVGTAGIGQGFLFVISNGAQIDALGGAAAVGTATVSVVTPIALTAGAAVGDGTVALATPATVELADAAGAGAGGGFALTFPATVPLTPATGAGTGSAEVGTTAPIGAIGSGAAGGAFALTAPAIAPLATAAASGSGAVAVSAATALPLDATAAVSAGAGAVTAASGVAVDPAAAAGGGLAVMTAAARLPLQPASAAGAGEAEIIAPSAGAFLELAAAASAGGQLGLAAAARLGLAPGTATSAGAIAVTAAPNVQLSPGVTAGMGAVAVTAAPLLALSAALGLGDAMVLVTAPHFTPPVPHGPPQAVIGVARPGPVSVKADIGPARIS